MVTDHRYLRPHSIPEEVQVRCRPLRTDSLLESTHVISTQSQVGHFTVAWRVEKKFLWNRTVVEYHVSRWCRWYFSLWRTARLENSATGQTVVQNTLHNKCGRERTARRTQIVKPFIDYWVPNDSNGSTIYAIKEYSYEAEPGAIQGQSVF